MPLAKTVSTAFGAALIVLAASVDIPPVQTTSADAQTAAMHRDGSKIPEKVAPEGSGSSTEPLSNRLDRSGGVIHPPQGIDPGIAQSPPKIGSHSTPIIPPPGSAGESGVTPK